MTPNTKPSSGNRLLGLTDPATIFPVLSIEDIKLIAPLNRKGHPDLYNFMPTRLIPHEEAKYRGWGCFYQAVPCRYGHVAPRYTANIRKCIDCTRISKGKTTIGEKTGLNSQHFQKRANRDVIVEVKKVEEVDAWERKWLEAYAYHKDFEAACEAAGVRVSQVESRLAFSKPFEQAYESLEERLGIKRVAENPNFIWTQEKYDKLIRTYINTGDLATARDSVGTTPFEYYQELSRNPVFAERLKEADPLAHLALEERAIQLALAGNDKLLTKILSVKKPEYRENLKVEMNVTEKLDDRQLQARLLRLVNKLRPPDAIEGEYEVTQTRTVAALGTPRGDGQEEESKKDRPAIQHTGS